MLSKYLQVSNTDECSRCVVIIWLPRCLYLEATPFNTVLFDLVDEPRKKETPDTSLGGIPMTKVETKIIGGDNDYNKEKYHAVIPVPKSGENFIYIRKSSELRKNHYYIIRISLVETDSTGINTYKYFLKSLFIIFSF